jgi:hypothetical protein
MKNVIQDRRVKVRPNEQMTVTLAFIGKAIRDGSSYLPIRNLAASLAATAPRKDFPKQLKAIWDYFVKRWRYVRDPHGTETVTMNPRAIYNLVMGHNGGAGGKGFGVGDCDDATVAIGSMLMAAGFPVRIGTTAPPGMGGTAFTHVFAQAHVAPYGWVTVDPVLLPNAGLGAVAPHSRMAIWDLKGRLIATRGVSARALKNAYKMQRR